MVRRSQRLASKYKASETPPAEEKQPLPPPPSVSEPKDSPAEGPAEANAIRPPEPKTPGRSSPIKPPMSEMHPSKVHPTMGAPSSAQRLGFTDIKPTAGRSDLPSAIQATPSRITVPSSDFTFRSAHRPLAVEALSEEAQKMMAEIREQAKNLKEVVRTEMEQEALQDASARSMAQAKKQGGRFSAAHQAEFDKMESIANHPSAFRLQKNRTTPQTAGVKRSQSKANLDEPDAPCSKTPASAAQPKRPAAAEEKATGAKRARQTIDDDVSSKRPGSRDGTTSIPAPKPTPRPAGQIPRPKPAFASLMTPTKSSLAKTCGAKTPSQSTLARSPSKAAALSGIPRATATPNPPGTSTSTSTKEPAARQILSPRSRLAQLKEKFLSTKADAPQAKSAPALPSALASKTPAPARVHKETLPVPMTTPGRKLAKRVTFTPDTKRAAVDPKSPSPVKSCIPQIKKRVPGGAVHYPLLDGILAESAESAEPTVSYPDLSSKLPQQALPEPRVPSFKADSAEASVPSEFTFRSDHTISFGSPAKSFGAHPGQASVRVVRPSMHPVETAAASAVMPGSFPGSANSSGADADDEADADKENEAPTAPTTAQKKERTAFLALPHGMSTKKRNRVSTDEEEAEQEAAERASKKLRRELVPEGEALLAPRLVAAAKAARAAGATGTAAANGAGAGSSVPVKKVVASSSTGGIAASPRRLQMPGHMPATPSPMKKRGISWSRLNLLAQPKLRK
ncbi:hypothetical protein VTJ83DRAFT_2648 [Remersonia thermophila]|uniref:Erythromycin esterase n=1 Tax=Remersonia thermophila TaxID=72144 RepID=A0ABR4DM51_9PEZI